MQNGKCHFTGYMSLSLSCCNKLIFEGYEGATYVDNRGKVTERQQLLPDQRMVPIEYKNRKHD